MADPAFKYPPDGIDEMTAEEFLNRPDDLDGTKYELVDGALRAMSPASVRHGAIQATIARALLATTSPLRFQMYRRQRADRRGSRSREV